MYSLYIMYVVSFLIYIYMFMYVFCKHMRAHLQAGICRQIAKFMSGNTEFLQQRANWGTYRKT
jgi:hypothetical protein